MPAQKQMNHILNRCLTQNVSYHTQIKDSMNPMDNLNYVQKRLDFIDFKLMFVGYFRCSEVVEHFKMGLSQETCNINLYKDLSNF